MTGRKSNATRTAPIEVRVLLPADVHEDIVAMARITGLATSQYIRTLVMTHRAKTYANTEKNT